MKSQPKFVQNSDVPEAELQLEAQLRAVAPLIPPALRSRTLMRCAVERETLRRNRRRGQLRWAWAMAGLCAFHWGAISVLDAQNSALINGKTPPTVIASAPVTLDQVRVAMAVRAYILSISPPENFSQSLDVPRDEHRAG